MNEEPVKNEIDNELGPIVTAGDNIVGVYGPNDKPKGMATIIPDEPVDMFPSDAPEQPIDEVSNTELA